MSKTENLILQLTSRALFNAPVEFNPTTVDWTNLYKEASNQALTLLIWDTLTDEERAAVPENIAAIWEQDAMIHVLRNEQLLYSQDTGSRTTYKAGSILVMVRGDCESQFIPGCGNHPECGVIHACGHLVTAPKFPAQTGTPFLLILLPIHRTDTVFYVSRINGMG